MRKNSYGKKFKRGSPANKCAFKYKGKFYTYYSIVKGFSHSHTLASIQVRFFFFFFLLVSSILKRRSTCGSQPTFPQVLFMNVALRYFRLTAYHHIFILCAFFICFFFNFLCVASQNQAHDVPPTFTHTLHTSDLEQLVEPFWERNYNFEIASQNKTVTAFAHSISWRCWVKKKQFGTAFYRSCLICCRCALYEKIWWENFMRRQYFCFWWNTLWTLKDLGFIFSTLYF